MKIPRYESDVKAWYRGFFIRWTNLEIVLKFLDGGGIITIVFWLGVTLVYHFGLR